MPSAGLYDLSLMSPWLLLVLGLGACSAVTAATAFTGSRKIAESALNARIAAVGEHEIPLELSRLAHEFSVRGYGPAHYIVVVPPDPQHAPQPKVLMRDPSRTADLRFAYDSGMRSEPQHAQIRLTITSRFSGGRFSTSNIVFGRYLECDYVQTVRGNAAQVVAAHEQTIAALQVRGATPVALDEDATARYSEDFGREARALADGIRRRRYSITLLRGNFRAPELHAPVQDAATLDRIAHVLQGAPQRQG